MPVCLFACIALQTPLDSVPDCPPVCLRHLSCAPVCFACLPVCLPVCPHRPTDPARQRAWLPACLPASPQLCACLLCLSACLLHGPLDPLNSVPVLLTCQPAASFNAQLPPTYPGTGSRP